MKKAILIATGVIGLGIVSCKKDDNGKVLTNVDLITSTNWKIDTIGLDNDANGVIDFAIPGGFASCELDNTLTFSSDSSGVFDEGASKCNDADPQSASFSWYFKENDKVIHIDGSLEENLAGDAKVLTLTNSSMVLSKEISITDPLPISSNLIISLKK